MTQGGDRRGHRRRRQNVRADFNKTSLLLEVDKSLGRQGDQFRKAALSREVLDKRDQLTSESLIFVGSIDVEASQFSHLMFWVRIHCHATDNMAVNLQNPIVV